mgnify:CR=1 FL=1
MPSLSSQRSTPLSKNSWSQRTLQPIARTMHQPAPSFTPSPASSRVPIDAAAFRGSRRLVAVLVSTLLTIALYGCLEEDNGPSEDLVELTPSTRCNPPCTGDRQCYEAEGACTGSACFVCLTPDCPADNPTSRCATGARCVDGRCQFVNECDPACAAGTHCVFNVCVPNYTTANVCDPLARCRTLCGTNAGCLAACERDRSTTCRDCLAALNTCESRELCSGNAEGCCTGQYCACFPTAPGCGNVPPCDICLDQCGSSTTCFNDCLRSTLSCSQCLQPFNQCRETQTPSECQPLFCDCATCD